MIKDRNIANDASIQIHKLVGSGLLGAGEIFYVGTAGTNAYNLWSPRAESAGKLFTSITAALSRCVASRYDNIIVLPGHIETIDSAGALTLDKIGVKIYFMGSGSSKAYCDFTATAGTLLVSAAGVELFSPKFVTGIDAVVAAINPQAADFKMHDVEFHDAAAKAATIQVLSTAAAARMVIDGYRYFASTTGTQKTDGIKLVGGSGIVLKNIDITGDFTNSPINISTTTLLNTLENINANNTSSSPAPAMTVGANATGFAKNVKARVASGTTYVSSVAKIQWAEDCEGFSTDGYSGEPIGTAVGTGLEGKIDVIDGYFDVPTADATTDTTIRDVVGRKTDAAINAVGTTKTIMAYAKGIVNEITVPAPDATANGFTNDVVGNKEDAAAVVGTTKSLVANVKQVTNQGQKLDAAAIAASPAAGSFITYLPRSVEKSDGAVLDAATDDLFTITGGPVRCKIVGLVTTAIGGAANMSLQHTTTDPAATVELNAAPVAITSDAAGTIYTNVGATSVFTPSTGLGFKIGDPVTVEEVEFILAPGTVKALGSAVQSGVIKWYMTYWPLSPNSLVVAAA